MEMNNIGFISKIFRIWSSIETNLENQYVPLIQSRIGLSYSQSISLFNDLLKMLKEESKNEGVLQIPSGDILLENENTNQKFKNFLDKIRKEGVRDEDIRWWWNLHDLERRMIKKFDLINQNTILNKLREEENMTADELKNVVRKYFPLYGDPDNITNDSGEHRPIPYELQGRIKKYIERRLTIDREDYRKDLEISESFNSLIRKELNNGSL
jgi:hypothetical protein